MTVKDGVSVTEVPLLKVGSIWYSSPPNDPAWDIIYNKFNSPTSSMRSSFPVELHPPSVAEHYGQGRDVRQELISIEG